MELQKKQFNITTDDAGNWRLQVSNTFDDGLHSAILTTDDVDQQGSGLFYIKSQSLVESVTQVFPPILTISILLLFILVLIGVLQSVRLSRLIKSADNSDMIDLLKWRRKVVRSASVITTLLIVTAIVIVIAVQLSTDVFNPKKIAIQEPQKTDNLFDLSGEVIEPLTDIPVLGVDLVVGDTSIRTGEGGAYIFHNLKDDDFITITHPKLRMAFAKQVEDVTQMQIFFDPELYNEIVSIAESEARNQVRLIYPLLNLDQQARVSQSQFIREYSLFYDAEHLNDQEIRIGQIKTVLSLSSSNNDEQYSNVVSVELLYKGGSKVYYFVKENGLWKLVW